MSKFDKSNDDVDVNDDNKDNYINDDLLSGVRGHICGNMQKAETCRKLKHEKNTES